MVQIIPVIHVNTDRQLERNLDIVLDSGITKVFLINHGFHYKELYDVAESVYLDRPSLWVGINPFGAQRPDIPEWLSGLWTDWLIRGLSPHKHSLYFGSVAFKGGPICKFPDTAAVAAMPYCNVVTTSGPATGKPPTVEKIRIMKEALGSFPLAIASGITPENAPLFAPYADYFLVATGISKDFHNLDASKLDALIKAVQ